VLEIDPVSAWSKQERALPADVAAELAATDIVKVIPLPTPGRWTIETDSRIGIIIGDGWELRIRPHLAIPKLMFLLAYTLRPDGWRDAITGMDVEQDVVEALASGFSLHAHRAIQRGLLRDYVAIEERRNDLRGRVRFGDQLARLQGLALPLEVSYDDFTADIPENRMLLTAAEILLLRRIPSQARSKLLRLRALLEEVTVLPDHRGAKLPAVTRLNRQYEPALVLAKLILDGTSLRQDAGRTQATSFLFDMNEVFESFVFIALQDAMRPYGGLLERQARGALDTSLSPKLGFSADIVWRRHGSVRAVIDSKYKPLSGTGSTPNADTYQMLAYCIGFGVPRGYLVYARDAYPQPRVHQIKRHAYQIDTQAVDVEQEPESLGGVPVPG
jgi:5-methylcytosine-specific restriction enzyme subunit McrC